MIPGELKYTSEHEWVKGESDNIVQVGITQYAQESLGDIVYVSLPAAGTNLSAGDSCGEVESTKSVSELYAPVSGEVVEVNVAVDANPELINSSPYEQGWLMRIKMSEPSQVDGLLTASDYEGMTQGA